MSNLDNETSDQRPTEKPAAKFEQGQGHLSYDDVTDILTFHGFKFSGEFMRQLTASPCGISFRIVERKDGVITITQDRDLMAVAAPDMLAALREIAVGLENTGSTPGKWLTSITKPDAWSIAREAIAKAEGRL